MGYFARCVSMFPRHRFFRGLEAEKALLVQYWCSIAKDNTDLYPARLGLQKVDGFLILSSSGYLFSQYIRTVKNQAAIIFPQFVSVLALPGTVMDKQSWSIQCESSWQPDILVAQELLVQ